MARAGLRAFGLVFSLMASSWASAAGDATPAALRLIEPGQWELRERPVRQGPGRRLCVAHAWQLMQIEHPQPACGRFVVRDDPGAVAVTYDCGRTGNGRTDLRVESPRLVQIRSQGVSRGLPFDLALEGRRIGAC